MMAGLIMEQNGICNRPFSSKNDTRLRDGRGARPAALLLLPGYYGREARDTYSLPNMVRDTYRPIPGLHDQPDQHLYVRDAVAKRPRLG